MPIQPGVWGIDLGQCALKAVRLEEINGQLTATAFDYVEHPKILSQPDADPDELTREALTKFLSRNNLRGDIVAISVPGQSGLARFVKLPPVEEKKIGDIVRFEAKQQIPFNLDEVVWDYQKIGSGIVTDGFAMETEIGLFAMKRDMVNRYLQHFKDVTVEVHVVQMAPLALCNFVAYDLLQKGPTPEGGGEAAVGKKRCVVALDIGADSSSLVITDGERIIWQRPIPIGGNHFTRALTKDLKLTFAKAEHLKRNATKSPDLKKILSSLKPVLNDFVGEVQRSLGYFTNTHRDAQIEYMVGLGNAFRLPGLQRFLGEKLQLDVRKLQKLERLTGDGVITAPVYTENILSFGVAYGLALQGLKQARLVTNLLPGEIRMERLVRGKKPWAVASAAALLLGLGALALSYFFEDRTYGHQTVVDGIKKAKDATTAATNSQRTFEDTKKAAEDQVEAVKSIVAGQEERQNWMKFTQFVSSVIPQPDGKNLPPSAKPLYWENRDDFGRKGQPVYSGEEAYQEYRKRLAAATKAGSDKGDPTAESPASRDPLGAEVDDLIQFHIDKITPRWEEKLPDWWKKTSEAGKEFVRPTTDWNKVPEGGGWVIEIVGHTFHHRKNQFVLNTLVENIARLSIDESSAKPASGAAVPPGGVPGALPPAPPMPPPAGPAKPNKLPKKPADKKVDPVINQKISHVILYKATTTDASAPSGGTARSATGAPPGPTRPATTKSGDAGADTVPPGAHARTTFTIYFIWKEPTPSDKLRGLDAAPATPEGGENPQGGATGMPPGMPPGGMRRP